MQHFVDAHPGVLGWLLVALAVSAAGGVVLERSGRARALPAGLLLAAVLLPLALTLTPARGGGGARECTTVLRPYDWWGQGGEEYANALMLLPVGLLAPLLLGRRAVPVVVAAALLPLGLEGVQYVLPALGRSCDVLDLLLNGGGLLGGVVLGLAGRLALLGLRRARTGPGPRRSASRGT